MVDYKVLIGSKVQVYRGIAKETSGGLTKKDIVKVVDKNDVTHYKSKKQQANGSSRNKKSQQGRQLWTRAYKKALKSMREKDDYYQSNILMFNPEKTYTGFTSKQLSKGKALYKETRLIYSK
jgi:hypothetical protein